MKPTAKMNIVDRAVGFVDPRAALRRMHARAAISLAERKFDAASRSRRTEGWITTGSSANAVARPAMKLIRDRSRDLARNNSLGRRAIDVIETNTVGTGIRPHITVREGGNQAVADNLMALWKDWAETPLCDSEEQDTLYDLQGLLMRSVAESGECLARVRRRRASDGLPIPIQIQLMEGDHLDDARDGTKNGGNPLVQGIEFTPFGRRHAYWLFPEHPGEQRVFRTSESKPIPAADIAHSYRVDRPGQVRGLAWGAPVIVKMKDLSDYEDAQLLRIKMASLFTAFEHDLGEGASDVTVEADDLDFLEPGAIVRLGTGRDITFASPPGVPNPEWYAKDQQRQIAMAFGITYEALTGDLKGVNFSSGRMGWIEMQRSIRQWQRRLVVNRFCYRVWRWFLEAAALMGHETEGVHVTWTPPRREMIDPTKEVPAKQAEVRAGFVSLSEAIREQGRDPREVLEDIARDYELLDSLGVKVETDGRNESRSTTGSTADPESEKDEETEDGEEGPSAEADE